MNICFLSNNNLNPQIGGVERVTYILANDFQKLGHKVYCISINANTESDNKFLSEEINQLVLPDKNNILSAENIYSFHHRLLLDKIDILINQSERYQMFELAIQSKKDTNARLINVLHTAPDATLKDLTDSHLKNANVSSAVSLLFNKLLVTLKYPLSYYLRIKHLRKKYSKIYAECDAFVLLSEHFFDKFIGIAKIEDGNKLKVIPNPCSFSPSTEITAKKNQIVFVGRMIFQAKRPDRILNIWSRLYQKFPDWNLIMVGDGPDINRIKEMSASLHLKNIQFTGNVDPSKYYQESKILCMTSTHEGFPMVLNEAMQYGCVPLAFDSFESVIDIMVQGENGILIKPFKLRNYENELALLMKDEKRRTKLAANAMRSIDKFNPDFIVSEWNKLFTEIA